MSTPDHRLNARRELRTRSCFNGRDILPSKLRVVEIGIATIVVCGPTCEAEARARILLRVHGSLPTAFRQALHDWQKWTGRADVTLTLTRLRSEGGMARAFLLRLLREAVPAAQGRHDEALEDALPAKIRVRQR